MTWTHHDRVNALLHGELADRPAVAAWQHFIPDETDTATLAATTVAYTRRHDWDWVKINPRGSYWPETWGHVYDYDAYTGPAPTLVERRIRSSADLGAVEQVDASGAPPLAQQLDLVRLLRAELPDRPLLQTLFSPLGVLLTLALGAEGEPSGPVGRVSRTARVVDEAGAAVVHRALAAIAATQAAHVTELLRAGADGIFYAVLHTAHPSATTPEEFAEFSTPYDQIVLEAATGGARIAHTCGAQSDPARFADYPAQALHWDQHADGNPGIDLDVPVAVVGGVSNEALGANDADLVARQAADALSLRRGTPFFLTPSCATPTNVVASTLDVLREAVGA